MRIIGILILGASLVSLSACAEQPGKKKEEKSEAIDDKNTVVKKVDAKKDDTKKDEKVKAEAVKKE